MIDQLNAAREALQAEGSLFETTEAEVRGIPMRVFAQAPATMRNLWELAAFHGDKDYLVFEDERLTYAEVDARVKALAHVLREDYGVGPGDRVAVAMRNYPEWVISYWATVCVGAALVGMNAWWTGPEMEFGLTDSAPKVLIVDGERLERVVPHLETVRAKSPLAVITVRTDAELPEGAVRWEDVIDPANAPATLPDAEIDPDDDATIFYTSGTTGFPKGAQLTHRGSVHNIMNIAYMPRWLALAVAMEDGTVEQYQADEAEEKTLVFMAPTPLFHVTACNCIMHPATLVGAKLVLTYKWDAGRAIELIEREGVTNFSGVPTMSREMLMHPDWETRDTSTLVGLGGGGAPLHADLVAKIDQSLKNEKGSPSTGYGLTETHGIVTANSSRTYLAKPDSCGPLVPTLEGKLVDDLGNDLPPGPDTVGQLCVRGPIVIKGYINRPEATAESIVDGWFNTGDIARIDDEGFVFIVDRWKDMYISGGENVYPAEVENVLYQLPEVAEAAIIGIPNDRWGEVGLAVIALKPGASLERTTVIEHCVTRLAKFKVPSDITIVEELPRNATGKVLKRELRSQFVDADAPMIS